MAVILARLQPQVPGWQYALLPWNFFVPANVLFNSHALWCQATKVCETLIVSAEVRKSYHYQIARKKAMAHKQKSMARNRGAPTCQVSHKTLPYSKQKKENKMFKSTFTVFRPLFFTLLVIGLVSSGCSQNRLPESANEGETVDFRAVAGGDSMQATFESPTILVGTDPSDAAEIGQLLDDPEAQSRLAQVDFQSKWVVAVFDGTKPSSGYTTTIDKVTHTDGEVRLYLRQTEPDPEQMVAAVLTHPYHIIEIDRSALPVDSSTVWKVYNADGHLLLQADAEPRQEQPGPGEPRQDSSSFRFQTVAAGESFTADIAMPTIIVAATSPEIDSLGQLLTDSDVPQQLAGVDWQAQWVVALFSGSVPSSGYGITVEKVEVEGDEVHLYAHLSEPNPDYMVAAVIAYPYHIITIPKSAFQPGQTSVWKLYDTEGTLLAETKYP
jgi:hypothetical protein